MEYFILIGMLIVVFVLFFDLVPYCIATILIGRFPPGGTLLWRALSSVFRRKPKYPTWDDI